MILEEFDFLNFFNIKNKDKRQIVRNYGVGAVTCISKEKMVTMINLQKYWNGEFIEGIESHAKTEKYIAQNYFGVEDSYIETFLYRNVVINYVSSELRDLAIIKIPNINGRLGIYKEMYDGIDCILNQLKNTNIKDFKVYIKHNQNKYKIEEFDKLREFLNSIIIENEQNCFYKLNDNER